MIAELGVILAPDDDGRAIFRRALHCLFSSVTEEWAQVVATVQRRGRSRVERQVTALLARLEQGEADGTGP